MVVEMQLLQWFLIFYLVAIFIVITCDQFTRDKDAPLCFGIVCENGGTLDNETCECTCNEPATGLFCEKEQLTSDWPKGRYGIPLSQHGCPETELHGWKTGYINMTVSTSSPDHNFHLNRPTYDFLFLMGPFNKNHFQMNFCIKISGNTRNATWPSGSYCIYRVGGVCANGFKSGSITINGYEFSSSDMSGWLPDHRVKRDNMSSAISLDIFYCCRNDNRSESDHFSFGHGWPFFLLKNDQSCPNQQGMGSTVQYYNFTSGLNGWNYTDVHPDLTTIVDREQRTNRMGYCYYTPPDDAPWKWETDPRLTSSEFRTIFGRAWVQVDMQSLYKVVYVVLTSANGPHVLLSRHQWVFRNHGAIRCDYSWQHQRYDCRRPTEMRYVTVFHFFSLVLSEINIIVTGESCGKQMGVVSGEIAEYQISTSARQPIVQPSDKICLKSADDGVYIQIDLIVPMVVQGLKIQKDTDEATTTFSIFYGVSADGLKKYSDPSGNQVFKIKNDETDFITIWLASEILATFIKIEFEEYDTDPCFKIELLGCPRKMSRDVKCESSSTYFGWATIQNKNFYDVYAKKPKWWISVQAKDFKPCEDKCLLLPFCSSATLFDTLCYLYDFQRHGSSTLGEDSQGAFYGEKICLSDVHDSRKCGHEIKAPLVLKSPLYPLYYGEARTCTWRVVFPVNMTIRLEILEIDFPAPEDRQMGGCEDQLIIFDIFPATGSPPKLEKMRLIKEKHRGSVLYSSSNELLIELKSCYHYKDIFVANRSRFALDISEADIPGCGYITETYKSNCSSQRGILASPFYPSTYSAKAKITWTILALPLQYIELSFSVIDIPSDSECYVAHVAVYDVRMEGANYRKMIDKYCSEKQKPEFIKSEWNILEIIMFSGSKETGNGFIATYEIKDVDFHIKEGDWGHTWSGCLDGWIEWKQHCYNLFQENATLLWKNAEKICNGKGGHLLSIEDREEMQYIHYIMTAKWKTFVPTMVGLYKHSADGKLNDFRWTNGKVATYFNWFSDQTLKEPDGHSSEQCTRIEPNAVWSMQTWHDYMCAFNGYNSFICKVTTEMTGIVPDVVHADNSSVDRSWWFICNDDSVISIVYKCDGVNDCKDASDEIQCGDYRETNQFRCSNGKFIQFSLYCDHDSACSDGSDETACEFMECREDEWQCSNQQCIPRHNQCDFQADCSDRSDEEDCTLCIDEGFQCFDQTCIPTSRLNDGFIDCIGSYYEDERNAWNRSVQYSCEAWYRLGMRRDGMYSVNYGLKDIFRVQCQFPKNASSKIKVVVNYMYHRLYASPNSVNEIEYEATLEQIRQLMSKTSCKQTVSVKCPGYYSLTLKLHWWTYPIETEDKAERYLHCGWGSRTLSEQTARTYLPLWAIENLSSDVRVGPLICEEAIQNTPHRQLFCKNGIITDREHRCILKLDKNGEVEGCRDMSHLEECGEFECPENYVKCPGSFCIPRYMYCDGLKHCPNGVDEIGCGNTSCSGLFKCRNSTVCIPLSEMCDGIKQCGHGDDEMLCDIACPLNCTCDGLVFTCSDFPDLLQLSSRVRKLNISRADSDGRQLELSHMAYLGQLTVTHAKLNTLENGTFQSSKNMFHLDLSNNRINHINASTLDGLTNLLYLNISNNKITNVHAGTFRQVPNLQTLDMRGNTIATFCGSMFDGMPKLQYLYTDEYRFCCIKPESVTNKNCYPPEDEFSSCADLMREKSMRICLWVIGSLALIGNGLSIVYRIGFDRVSLNKSHGVLVLNLCAADFLMGVYLYIIAAADEYYRGRYIYNADFWRHSIGCKVAGVIATLSSEASTTVLCVITLDRVLAIKYPFSAFRFNSFRAWVSALVIWIVNICISTIPMSGGSYFENRFYSKSGTCLALPLTRDRPPGWQYAIGVFLVYNFLSFVVIVMGQIAIYIEIQPGSSISSNKSDRREQNIGIARNLFLIVFTDFLCWFPIAIMGLAALFGYPIPGEMYAWTTIFILPINSAVNPLLYTLNAYRQKRRKTRHQTQITELTSEIEKLRHARSTKTHDFDNKENGEQVRKLQMKNEELLERIKEMAKVDGEQKDLMEQNHKLLLKIDELQEAIKEIKKTEDEQISLSEV